MNVAVVGASTDKSKFGNKAVRAYSMMGHTVFPIHPKEREIEGIEAYPSVLKVPYKIDRITVYVPPAVGLTLVGQFKKSGAREVYLNPGSESGELVAALKKAGISPKLECSIIAIGADPKSL